MNRKIISLIAAAGLMAGTTQVKAMDDFARCIYNKNQSLVTQTIEIDNVKYTTQPDPTYTFLAAQLNLDHSVRYACPTFIVPVGIVIAPVSHPALVSTTAIACPSYYRAAPKSIPLKGGPCAWAAFPAYSDDEYGKKVHSLLEKAVQQVHINAQNKVLERETLGDTGMSFWAGM